MIRLSPLLQFLARVSLLAVFILISACGGGSSSSDSASSLSDNTVDLVTSAFSGSVGDGPIVGATLRIYDKDNNLVQTLVSDSNAHYSTRIKTKGNAYPLTIVVEDGTDLVTGLAPDFRMTSVVSHPSVKRANINPYTTLIVESAGAMPGGLSDENISAARAAIMDQLNFGLDPAFIADPIVTQVTDENAAVIIKASEVLGEMIRRTRDQLLVTGSVVSADDVVNAIADDITDGSIDGVGAKRANGRISAVSTLVSAQVLIEALSNNLNVNGVRATDKLDAAIASTQSSTPTVAMTGDVRINREMLVQVRETVAAARALSPSIELTTIADILDNIQDNSLPSNIEPVLPGDSSVDLDPVTTSAVLATDEQLELVNNANKIEQPVGGSDPVNSAPQLSGNPLTSVLEGSDYLFQPVASDADADTLVFIVSNKPSWATFDSTSGRLAGTPGAADARVYSDIVVSVSDGSATDSLGPFSITVGSVNHAPAISGNAQTSANEGVLYSFKPTASDPDGDSLVFSISGRPSWATFDTGTGRLSGTPDASNAGTYSNIVINVSDGTASSSIPAFAIVVNANIPSNTAPTISGSPSTKATEDSVYVYQPNALDADGDKLTFSISNHPSWASFNTGTGRLSGTPGNDDVGTYTNIIINVSDGSASASTGAFNITVSNTNDAPTISGSPASSVAEDSAYLFQPNAFDADGDKLTFSISNRPSWASFNTSNGRLSGTPDNGDVGTYSSITISVNDGAASATTGPFSITVNNTNDAPVISGAPAASVEEKNSYSFQPSASDPDGDKLVFSISGRPFWASINSSSGRLSGTPAQGNAGTYSNIVISVSDGSETAGLPAFSIRVDAVAPANNAPVINGTPARTVVAGNSYEFQPSATDADGNPLTFSISNKPNWASFNTATGKLSGAPGVSDQGFYDNIVISVGDGTDLVSLAAFSIRVDAAVSAARVVTDLVAYYPFTEGAGGLITDQSGNGAPMDLTITGSVNWLGGGNGVMMNGGRVGTSGAATKMIDALRLSNTSSFEVWVKPANLTQSGPTRMVSLASGTSQQNFMIGQVGSGVEARLMHEGKDVSGQPRLTTGNGVLSVSPIHLVHTYDGAVERLYVNGVRHSETVAIGGAYRNWDVLGLFSIGNEASLNRPYAGVIYLVAVYDRALGVAEIQQNFSAGPGNTGDSGGSESLNTAPIISGSPAGSALAGNSYSFQPNATDADGDSLAFSISNKPGWASFDVVTGRLTGAPSDADAGTYSNVVISVTDGVEVVSLAAFSIQVDVAQTQTGSFTLSWTAPVSRADGTSLSLSEIAGYRIHYGVSPGSYSSSIDGGNGAAQTKTVNNIPAGTYYVVMTTRDSGGRESGYSQMVTKVTQ